jgi:hypothetical protein
MHAMDSLFCNGCAKRYPPETPGEPMQDAKGHSRWHCAACCEARRRHAKKQARLFNTAKARA